MKARHELKRPEPVRTGLHDGGPWLYAPVPNRRRDGRRSRQQGECVMAKWTMQTGIESAPKGAAVEAITQAQADTEMRVAVIARRVAEHGRAHPAVVSNRYIDDVLDERIAHIRDALADQRDIEKES